jgi:sortase A
MSVMSLRSRFAGRGRVPPRPRRRWLRRVAIGGNAALALVGIALVLQPFLTDQWARRVVQPRAASALRRPEAAAAFRANHIGTAGPVTRLVIPRLGVDVVVVQGITTSALRAGAGHYPWTPLPGQPGNVAIAGHRTTYGAPFRHLERLRTDDVLQLFTPIGRFDYAVLAPARPIAPTDLSVLRSDGRALVTLTTCNPVGSARERLMVQARLVFAEPGAPVDA